MSKDIEVKKSKSKDKESVKKDEIKDIPQYKTFVIHSAKYKTLLTKKFSNRVKYVPPDPKKIYAFIPGTIRKVYVKEGKTVRKGQNLLILEAMKMNNILKTSIGGKVKKVTVKEGDLVNKQQMLVEIE